MQDKHNPQDDISTDEISDNSHDSEQSGDDEQRRKDKDKDKDKVKAHSSEYTEDNCPFKKGESLTFVNIRFPGNAKAQPFLIAGMKLNYRQQVMAMSDRGVTVGYVNSLPFELPFTKEMLPLRKIIRLATDEDVEKQKNAAAEEKRAENTCLSYIQRYQLQMTLTHVEIMQFGKKAVFYFTAPERVDFRELVKSLVGDLKMRIELRQITVRDRSAAIGAIGICGRQNCCSSFLTNYGNVTIKMAKNQSLALLPNKINGVCGQLKCCIRYEDDVYSEKRKRLPEEGGFIRTQNGDQGKVIRLHVLAEQFDLLTDRGQKRRYARSQFNPKTALSEGWRFPEYFEHIVDETGEVIGKEIKQAIVEPVGQPQIERIIKDSDYIENIDQQFEQNSPSTHEVAPPAKPKESAIANKGENPNTDEQSAKRSSKDRRRHFHRRPKK